MTGGLSRRLLVRVAGVAGLALLAGCALPFAGSQATKVRRIAHLSGAPPSRAISEQLSAFREGMRDLGYVEGQNYLINERRASGADQLAQPAAELACSQPDVILVPAVADALAARAATTTIPIVSAGVGTGADLVEVGLAEAAFDAAVRGRADGLFVFGGPVAGANQERIGELAVRSRLPSMWQTTDAVSRGGLMAYGPNRADPYRRAAYFVDKILQGIRPADLPVQHPTRFDLVINLTTARALGLTIPQAVLMQATEVIP